MKSQIKGDATMNDDIKRPGNPYDLISEEDRETLRWVREQGGLEHVKNLHWLGAECASIMAGMKKYEDPFAEAVESLCKRLMPEGYEWPRYEDGESVKRPKVLAADGEPLEARQTVWGVETGQEYVVDAFVYDGSHGPYVVEGYYAGYNDVLHLDPSKLTHHQPKTRSANETAKGKHHVDRNALLALADEMVSVIWWDADVENQMSDWAERIRKACDGCDG